MPFRAEKPRIQAAGQGGMAAWRPVWAEIDLDAIRHNAAQLAARARPAGLMAVVKADGYGHGAVPVARAALGAGASWLGVATPDEGLALLAEGITAPVLVMGAFAPGQEVPFCGSGLRATIVDWTGADVLSRAAERSGCRVPVHLKVDTGMCRLGVWPEAAAELAERLAAQPGLFLEGLYTHLATADEADLAWTRVQLQRFTEVRQALRQRGIDPPWVHAANSAGLLRLPASGLDLNLARAGIALYGLYPSAATADALGGEGPGSGAKGAGDALRPALTWKARVAAVKRVPAGTGISYGLTYVTKRETMIAALPVGYADGYSRRLSHRAQVLIRGRRFPVVGHICMDQCLVDVGDAPVAVGDEVVLLGQQRRQDAPGAEEIPAAEMAKWLETIHYEVLCMIGVRVPRAYRG